MVSVSSTYNSRYMEFCIKKTKSVIYGDAEYDNGSVCVKYHDGLNNVGFFGGVILEITKDL